MTRQAPRRNQRLRVKCHTTTTTKLRLMKLIQMAESWLLTVTNNTHTWCKTSQRGAQETSVTTLTCFPTSKKCRWVCLRLPSIDRTTIKRRKLLTDWWARCKPKLQLPSKALTIYAKPHPSDKTQPTIMKDIVQATPRWNRWDRSSSTTSFTGKTWVPL